MTVSTAIETRQPSRGLLVWPPHQRPSCKLPHGMTDVRDPPTGPSPHLPSYSLWESCARGDRVHHVVSLEVKEQLLTSPPGKGTCKNRTRTHLKSN